MRRPECQFTLKNILFIVFLLAGFKAEAQSLLWKVSRSDMPSPSFLYGTIHITDARVFEKKDSVYKRLAMCDAFAAELDLSTENLMKIAGMMILPGDLTLHDYFSEEEYAMIRDAVRKCSGHELPVFDKIKPLALIGLCFSNRNPGDMEATVDELLYAYAREIDKTTFAIETAEEQIALFDKIPNSYVLEYFRNLEDQDIEFEKLIRCYRNADLDSLWLLMQDEESGSLLNEELIRLRNFRMTERIIPLMKSQSVFIAVGCGHLPGNDGIIELLKREGFTVVPEIME